MTRPIEQWKDIPSYEGRCQVSDLGRVRRIKTRYGIGDHIYSQKPNHFGYATVTLTVSPGRRKDYRVHVLVAHCFLGIKPQGKEINHKDGNKMNSHVDNLEYVTRLENIRHRDEVLGHTYRGESHYACKLTLEKVYQIRNLANEGVSQGQIAKQFNITQSNVSCIVRHKSWKHVA